MRLFATALILMLAAACTDRWPEELMGPRGGELALAGIEHVLEVDIGHIAARTSFVIESTLWNRGTEPVRLKVRSCTLDGRDVRGEDSRLWLHELPVPCDAKFREITLEPGASSETLRLMGSAPGPPVSAWSFAVRHALEPEQWTPVTVPGR